MADHNGQFTPGGYLSTVIHTTLAGIEPTTFRLLVRRATCRATEIINAQWNVVIYRVAALNSTAQLCRICLGDVVQSGEKMTHNRRVQFCFKIPNRHWKISEYVEGTIHRVSEKNKQNYFCYNYVKLTPNVVIFGTTMANYPKLYEVYSFSTSSNSRQCTTV